MTCTNYMSKFQKQLDGSAYQGLNCTCASAAMACDDDTCGYSVPTPALVRYWTGDKSGGTNLSEVDYALSAHTPTRLDVRYRYPWADFVKRVNAGESAILQGWYAPIADSRFDAGGGFRGNHAMLVTPRLVVLDPLADGRRAGVYKYHGEAYPEALLRDFAGRLNVAQKGYIRLGDGQCYVAFTRDNDASYRATVRPAGTRFMRYYVKGTGADRQIYGRKAYTTKGGFQLPCTPPALIWENGPGGAKISKRSLVQITAPGASYNGWWLDSKWSEKV